MSAPSEASTNPAEILSSFATLAPDNPAAHSAFEAVVTYVSGDPESYHGGFITRSDDNPESHGHYVFTFDQLPEVTQGFWRIGKGTSKIDTTRGVDILLARPGHNSASLVANVHAVILLHPDSGAFILRSTSKHPIRYLSGDGDDDLVLRHGEQAVLHMTANRFRFGPLDYLFTFRVEDETRFALARDAFIQSVTQPASSDLPHPQLDRLPRQVHHRIRDVIIHKTMGHGAFGMVKSGIHARTGQPLAIKLLQWKSGAKGQIDRELEIAKLFRDASRIICYPLPCLVSVFNPHVGRIPRHHPDSRRVVRARLLPSLPAVPERGDVHVHAARPPRLRPRGLVRSQRRRPPRPIPRHATRRREPAFQGCHAPRHLPRELAHPVVRSADGMPVRFW